MLESIGKDHRLCYLTTSTKSLVFPLDIQMNAQVCIYFIVAWEDWSEDMYWRKGNIKKVYRIDRLNFDI